MTINASHVAPRCSPSLAPAARVVPNESTQKSTSEHSRLHQLFILGKECKSCQFPVPFSRRQSPICPEMTAHSARPASRDGSQGSPAEGGPAGAPEERPKPPSGVAFGKHGKPIIGHAASVARRKRHQAKGGTMEAGRANCHRAARRFGRVATATLVPPVEPPTRTAMRWASDSSVRTGTNCT
jgi:hypothetical protein